MPKHDSFFTLEQLNYGLRLFGLSCVYRDGTKLKHYGPIWKLSLYIIVFVVANLFSTYFKLQITHSENKITIFDSVHVSYWMNTVLYIIDVVYVYKYGRDLYIDYFNTYDTIDSILVNPSYHKIRKCIRNMCLYYIFMVTLSITIELYTWISTYTWLFVSTYLVEPLYLMIKALAALDLITNLVQVKYRLQVIGDLLEYCYYQDDNDPQVIKDVTAERVWISQEVRKSNHQGSSRAASVACRDVVKHLSKCYMLLVDQSDFINLKYGIRFLVSCLINLWDMVVLLNMVIRIFLGRLAIINTSNNLLIFASLVRIFSYTIVCFCEVYQCEQTYRQTERITRLINQLLISKNIGKLTRETLTELKDVISSRPLNYHAVNFFRIEYPTLVSLASIIVTYTIIFLQNLY